MASFQKLANKLLGALNYEGMDLTYNTKQFKGKEGRVMTMYWIGRNEWDPDKHRWENKELFRSVSLLRVVMYLRDMWYTLQGTPLPTDQVEWNMVRRSLKEKGDPIYAEWEEDL